MEEIYVAWNLGSPEGPKLVWRSAEVIDIATIQRKVVIVTALLYYLKIRSYTSSTSKVECLQSKRSPKLLSYFQLEDEGNSVITAWKAADEKKEKTLPTVTNPSGKESFPIHVPPVSGWLMNQMTTSAIMIGMILIITCQASKVQSMVMSL